jgi:hypothetical protein
MKRAICPLACIPMRHEPSDRSEMTNQVLFGETMEVLETTEKWAMVQLNHDNYTGWVDLKQIVSIDEMIVPDAKSVTAPLFVVRNENEGFSFLPAGSMARFISESEIICGNKKFLSAPMDAKNATAPAELALGAMIFLDTPYLWGGRTLMGIDCSGFTQLVFRMNGISIPRDAYQQAEIGEIITFIDEAETGDLAFFDNNEGRITHVGLIINQKELGIKSIIHASGKVRLDKLDHQGIFNEETKSYSHNLRLIKRIKI